MKLEEVTNGASLEGVEPATVVTVVAAIAILRTPFDAEPGWGVSSINFEIKALLARGGNPG